VVDGANVGGGQPTGQTVPQQVPAAAVAAAPVMVGNLAVAQQPQPQMYAQPSAQPAVLRAPAPPPPPAARAPLPGARPQTGYTLQSPAPAAAPRYAPPAQPAPQALQPHPDPEVGSYEQTGYADPQAARQALPQRPQQPQRPAQRPVEPRIPGRSATLFAEPPPAQPQAPAPAPRTSLFGRVTGAFRGHQAEAPPPALPPQPTYRAETQEYREPPRASVRQASGEEGAIDIPAFLRRQSS
jgi:hypothetical protein